MAQAPAPAATLASLPREVATAILRRVPLEQRLGPCACACRALAAAAAAATDKVEVNLSRGQQRADALSGWLAANGGCMVRLVLRGAVHLEVRLPAQCMAQLQELTVWGPQLKVAAPSASASPPQGLTHLSRLCVDGSSIVSACASLQSLSALSGLRQLSVDGGVEYLSEEEEQEEEQEEEEEEQQQQQHALGQLLAHATQLTQLAVTGELQAAALAGLSALTQLQELDLPAVSGSTAAWLPALPISLTQLQLESLDCSGSAADRLGQLTALQVLWLPQAQELRPALLSSLVSLRHLDLSEADLAGGQGGGGTGLLAALARLTKLEALQLYCVLQQPAAPAAQYAALTASSQLTELGLAFSVLPAGAGQHMFGQPGRRLPRLEQLSLAQPEDTPSEQRPLSQAGLDSLVACCPGLKQLYLRHAVAAGVQLTALAQLSALSELSLGGSGAVSSSTAAKLAACTGLRSLCVYCAPGLCNAAVLSLTRLQQLTSLQLSRCGLSQQLRDDGAASAGGQAWDHLSIYSQVRAGEAPGVWRQLRERCRRSPACAAAMLREADERVEQLEARVGAQAAQLAAQAAQLGTQTAQLGTQAAQLAQLQEHVAQLARLEGRLAQVEAAQRAPHA